MTTPTPLIWPPFEIFYIQSMLFNSTSAIKSIARLHRAFGQLPPSPTLDDIVSLPAKLVLDDLQNMILQGAALSRYFWPVRKGHESRAQALRHSFSITESSPLFKRDLRNALEHFDERLDEYLEAGLVGCVFPEYVGPKPAGDGVPGHFFRAYFVDLGVFRLLDEEFAIEPLAIELEGIHEKLESMDADGGRLQRKIDGP